MYNCILSIDKLKTRLHLTSSLFPWKPFKNVNAGFPLGLIEEILLNFRGRDFFILSALFILKKNRSPERVLIKICFRYKMMVIFFKVAFVNNLLKSFMALELQDLHSTLKILRQLTEESSCWIHMGGSMAGLSTYLMNEGINVYLSQM